MLRAADLARAAKARAHGARYCRIIIGACREHGLPLALGFAMVEQESNFQNVYGHDAVRNPAPKGGHVTRDNYLGTYLPARRAGAGMQGVGPAQLTWYAFQDEADKAGGCWLPRHSIPVGIKVLADNVRQHGTVVGVARYNGTGPAADAYSRQVRERADKWRRRLWERAK